jgi:hypothetical protein
METLYAPGTRVVVRDCEWIVRRAAPCDDGGYSLTVDGLSELVSGKNAQFLTRLEKDADAIRVLVLSETHYDQTGRIVFTLSKGLVGGGLPHKAGKKELGEGTHYCVSAPGNQQQNTALGWEDMQHLTDGSVYKAYIDDTLPSGSTERTVEYKVPFFRPDREVDYRVA